LDPEAVKVEDDEGGDDIIQPRKKNMGCASENREVMRVSRINHLTVEAFELSRIGKLLSPNDLS